MSDEHSGEEHNQQWILVTKNKHKHKGSLKNKLIHARGNQNLLKPQHAQQCLDKFLNAKPFQLNYKIISETIDQVQLFSNSTHFHVECLGLGNFHSNKKCFIQFQFMKLIIIPIIQKIITKRQSIDKTHKSKIIFKQQQFSINVYDPAFTKQQTQHLNEAGYSSVQKFTIQKGKINLFFMPHCERFLYEAVYQQYSEIEDKNLTPLIVIGNSIDEYKERCLLIKQKIPDIFLKIKLKQKCIFDFQNALNDTFILV